MTQDDPAERLRQHLAERFGPGEGPADPSVPAEDETTDEPAAPDEEESEEPTPEQPA